MTNEDFIALDRFFQNPPPLFLATFHAVWTPNWVTRHRLTAAMLGVEVSDDLHMLKERDYRDARQRLAHSYLTKWAGAVSVLNKGSYISFDSLRMIEVLTDATKETLYSMECIGDDPTMVATTLFENLVLAIALAWQIHLGTKDFSTWDLRHIDP